MPILGTSQQAICSTFDQLPKLSAAKGVQRRIGFHDGNIRSSRRSVLLLGIIGTTSLQQPAIATPYGEAANIQYGLLNG